MWFFKFPNPSHKIDMWQAEAVNSSTRSKCTGNLSPNLLGVKTTGQHIFAIVSFACRQHPYGISLSALDRPRMLLLIKASQPFCWIANAVFETVCVSVSSSSRASALSTLCDQVARPTIKSTLYNPLTSDFCVLCIRSAKR